jgi:hypothetical protein
MLNGSWASRNPTKGCSADRRIRIRRRRIGYKHIGMDFTKFNNENIHNDIQHDIVNNSLQI